MSNPGDSDSGALPMEPVDCIAAHGVKTVSSLLLGPHFTSAVLVWSGMWKEVGGPP